VKLIYSPSEQDEPDELDEEAELEAFSLALLSFSSL